MAPETQSDVTVVAVLRRADGLLELSVGLGDDVPWSGKLRPVTSPPELVAAWRNLQAVREINTDVVRDVRLVLDATILDPTADRPELPSLAIEAPPAPHRATAANPRAYRGTKDRPPKPRRPKLMDLRPFLCVPGGQDRLLAMLEAELGALDLPTETRGLPANFQRYFSWSLRGEAFAPDFYWQLGLDDDVCFRRQVALLFARQPAQRALVWCRLLVGFEAETRSVFLGFLLAANGDDRDLDEGELLELGQAIAAIPRSWKHHVMRIYFLAEALSRQHSIAALRAGLQLARDYDSSWKPAHDCPPASAEDAAHIRRFVKTRVKPRLDNEDDYREHTTMKLWEGCGTLDGLGEILGAIPWATIEEQIALDFAIAITSLAKPLRQGEEPLLTSRQLDEARPLLIAFGEALAQTDKAYQRKALQFFENAIWQETVASTICELPDFIKRICKAPFSEGTNIDLSIERLCLRSDETIRAVLAAPDRSFLALEDAVQSRTNSFRISAGIDTISYSAGPLFREAFATAPKTLFRAALVMAALSYPVQKKLIHDLLKGRLSVKPGEHSGKELTALFDEHGPNTGTSPIPKRFRSYLNGELELKPGQIERHENRIRRAWNHVLLDSLREAAAARSQHGFGEQIVDTDLLSDQMQHALAFQLKAAENRRSLRRLIRACLEGDSDYLEQHPANRAWFEKHPKLDPEVWLRGPSITGNVEGRGEVTLTIESDPLEALRLGTYVGSCLALGGTHMHSAAAVVLDANKQVVFARDAKGAFVARQLLAINDKDELSCFDIYPSSKPEVLALFRDFDHALANQLGVPLEKYDSEQEESKIAQPISSDWWHDGLWDFDCEEASESPKSSL